MQWHLNVKIRVAYPFSLFFLSVRSIFFPPFDEMGNHVVICSHKLDFFWERPIQLRYAVSLQDTFVFSSESADYSVLDMWKISCGLT